MKPAADRKEDIEITRQPCRHAVIKAYRIVTNDPGSNLLKIAGMDSATQDRSVLPQNCLDKAVWIWLSGLPVKIGEPAIRISENLAMAYTKTPCGRISERSHMSSNTPLEFLFCFLA
jgi:hypothetical protein